MCEQAVFFYNNTYGKLLNPCTVHRYTTSAIITPIEQSRATT
jgi:hypothetical protein